MTKSQKIEIENVLSPGHVVRVDADKYQAMKRAFLEILPKKSPGMTAVEIGETVLPHLPEDLFPQGARAGWWKKAVQLDLEAKRVIIREETGLSAGANARAMPGTCARDGLRQGWPGEPLDQPGRSQDGARA